jgi:hypothetical protein
VLVRLDGAFLTIVCDVCVFACVFDTRHITNALALTITKKEHVNDRMYTCSKIKRTVHLPKVHVSFQPFVAICVALLVGTDSTAAQTGHAYVYVLPDVGRLTPQHMGTAWFSCAHVYQT